MFQNLSPRNKFILAFTYDLTMVLLSFQLALLIRVNDLSLISIANNFSYSLVIVIVHMITYYLVGFYKGVWRYSSTYDLIRLIKGTVIATVFSLLSLFMYNRLYDIPRSVFFIKWLILIISLGGGRLGYRILRDSVNFKNQSLNAKKILIIGAGSSGEQTFREIQKNKNLNMRVIGFVDDDKSLQKKQIHNCPVLGTVGDIKLIANQAEIDMIYVAIPSGTGDEIRRIHELTKDISIPVKVLPKFGDIINGNVKLSEFRDIDVTDILGRKEISLNNTLIKDMLKDKIILITGAGGSIGSEIVRQVSNFEPTKLYLLDNCEYNLYQIEKELSSKFPNIKHEVHMVDVRNKRNLRAVFNNRIDVIFHAAAYKHVPLVEANPHAGVETNIQGTLNIAELANEFKCQKLVLISSDKAVNPTNIMGATKRIAELICLREATKSLSTKFVTVRFGNVLGSSGSVIPLFTQQIKDGGPITVTHPDITRYFMSIPEASQLVLQAGSIGNGGEIFVLDMGKPILILDIAKQMISLSGKAENDIAIQYTGLRPGEKMYEELLLDSESTLNTVHPMVLMAQATDIPQEFDIRLDSLLSLSPQDEAILFKTRIKELLVQYSPENTIADMYKNDSKIN